MVAYFVAFGMHTYKQVFPTGNPLAHHEERRLNLFAGQYIKHARRNRRVWPVVKSERHTRHCGTVRDGKGRLIQAFHTRLASSDSQRAVRDGAIDSG
jgi:hypothetical protein